MKTNQPKAYRVTLDSDTANVLEKTARKKAMSASEYIEYILHLHLPLAHSMEGEMIDGYTECGNLNLAICNDDEMD